MDGPIQFLRLLVGPRLAMRAICAVVPRARAYATARGAGVLVMPLDDEVHEGLHRANGTGEWLELGSGDFTPQLTTTDAMFASSASAGSALAWFETQQGETGLWQVAAVWIDGAVAMKPNLLRAGENRPRSLRPVNSALRMVGVSAVGSADEFSALGLDGFETNEDLLARGSAAQI